MQRYDRWRGAAAGEDAGSEGGEGEEEGEMLPPSGVGTELVELPEQPSASPVLTTLDGEVTSEEVELVEAYAAALDIDERSVKTLRNLVEGHLRRMMFDLARRSFMPKVVGGIWREEGVRGLWTLVKAAAGEDGGTLADRVAARARAAGVSAPDPADLDVADLAETWIERALDD